jgi:hypothetical protein
MSEMRAPKTVWNPWLYNPFAEFVKAGYSSTPQKLNQPILPGWTFGNIISVSERNSSSPDTERRIVDQHSYGRQLGHLMDAMCDLIGERPASLRRTPAMESLMELKAEIEAIKYESCEDRIEQLRNLLAAVRRRDPQEYERLEDLLRAPLPDES